MSIDWKNKYISSKLKDKQHTIFCVHPRSKVDVWVIGVFRVSFFHIATWESTKEGIGQQGSYLSLRQCQHVCFLPLQQRYRPGKMKNTHHDEMYLDSDCCFLQPFHMVEGVANKEHPTVLTYLQILGRSSANVTIFGSTESKKSCLSLSPRTYQTSQHST